MRCKMAHFEARSNGVARGITFDQINRNRNKYLNYKCCNALQGQQKEKGNVRHKIQEQTQTF